MRCCLLLVATEVMVALAGCSDNESDQKPTARAIPEVSVAETQRREVPTDAAHNDPENEVARRSERWKAQRRVEDFFWLVTHAIPSGTSQARVEELLGKPLGSTDMVVWTYVEAEPVNGQVDTLSFRFDTNGVSLFSVWPKKGQQLRPLTDVPPVPWETPTEVREAYIATIRPLLKKIGLPPEAEYVPYLCSKPLWAVTRQRCSYALHLHERSLPLPSKILHGNVDNMRRDGECWCIRAEASPTDLVVFAPDAYLDVRTGELLLLVLRTQL